MQASFNLRRERQDGFYHSEVENPSTKLNFHSPIEIMMVERGEAEVWINERRETLRAGELAVAFSYDAHGCRSKPGSKMAYLIIPVELCGEFQPFLRQKRARDPFIRDRAVYERVGACLAELQGTENEMTRRGYLYVIMGTLLDRMALEDRREKVDPALSTQVLYYLNENFREELSLRSVAEALGYHPSYLSRYFKENFHIPFSRYLTMLRLRESVLLMREGNKSLADCAFESGFNSLRTFHRVFYEEFNRTPKVYMQRMKE